MGKKYVLTDNKESMTMMVTYYIRLDAAQMGL
jgi:hypothetical protein